MGKNFSPEELIRHIYEAAAPVAASFGLSLWGVDIINSGRTVVRVFVDAPGPAPEGDGVSGVLEGVDVDRCADISRMLGLALEVDDIFSGAWVLEVSSPGLDRMFFSPEQMPPYLNRDVDVTLLDPHPGFPGRRRFKGPLRAVNGNCFTVETPVPPAEGEKPVPADVNIDWNSVKKVRLIPVFPDTSKPGAGKKAGKAAGRTGGKQA